MVCGGGGGGLVVQAAIATTAAMAQKRLTEHKARDIEKSFDTPT
jgi:hypothetical protein